MQMPITYLKETLIAWEHNFRKGHRDKGKEYVNKLWKRSCRAIKQCNQCRIKISKRGQRAGLK